MTKLLIPVIIITILGAAGVGFYFMTHTNSPTKVMYQYETNGMDPADPTAQPTAQEGRVMYAPDDVKAGTMPPSASPTGSINSTDSSSAPSDDIDATINSMDFSDLDDGMSDLE